MGSAAPWLPPSNPPTDLFRPWILIVNSAMTSWILETSALSASIFFLDRSKKSLGVCYPVLHRTQLSLCPCLRKRLLPTCHCGILVANRHDCCLQLDNAGLRRLQLLVWVLVWLGNRGALHWWACILGLTLAFAFLWHRIVKDFFPGAWDGGRGPLKIVLQTASDKMSSKTHFLLRPMNCRG